jgi:hypothetical protein
MKIQLRHKYVFEQEEKQKEKQPNRGAKTTKLAISLVEQYTY